MLFDLFIGLLDVLFLGVLLIIINFYTTGAHPGGFHFMQALFNKDSMVLAGMFFLLYALKNWIGYRITKAQNFFFYEVASRLSKRNIRDYLNDDYFKFINIDSSVYIRKISQQPIEFSNYILTNVQQVISQGILIFFTVAAILFYHPGLFLSLFLLLLPPVVLLGYFIKMKLADVRTHSKLTSQLCLQYLNESLSGYIESNVYEKNDFFTHRYFRRQKQLNEYIAIQQTLQGLPSRLIEVFAILGFLVLIAINKWAANSHGISLLDIGVFMAASYKIIPGIVKILNSTGQIKTYEFVLNDLSPGETSADKSVEPEADGIHSIKFCKVDFKYRHHQVLEKLCLEIHPGDFVGISGSSGIGKTTIINLLLGFLEQDNGLIAINNADTSGFDRQQYWRRISYVKQQSFFINDSVLKNITLTEGPYDSVRLNEALAFCGMDAVIRRYPEGLNKVITENGKNISGGQRQRLMLARALYPDFDLLVLDEPFSEMDETAEKAILTKLRLLAREGKMIIIITHNKASLSFCNKTILLDGA